jgi:hypothetical protein
MKQFALILMTCAAFLIPKMGEAATPLISGLSPTTGPTDGGQIVTVWGAGFIATTQVYVGDVIGRNVQLVPSYTSSANLLFAQMPAHTVGKVDLAVVNSLTEYSIAYGAFTYIAASPTPTPTPTPAPTPSPTPSPQPTPTPNGSWTAPVGVPMPTFGISETAPAVPNPWNTEVAGFYYVNEQLGTDAGRIWGTPSAPRRTIPASLPAGAVVSLAGTYTPSQFTVYSQGTATKPVFIRGASPTSRPIIKGKMTINGAYLVLENFNGDFRSARLQVYASNIAVRDCDLKAESPLSDSEGIVVASASGVLITRCKLHDFGDVGTTSDLDLEGVFVAQNSSYVWIVDNEIYNTVGSGIQINAGTAANLSTLHHIYVARNRIHDTRQSGIGIKQSTDVIISQNVIYDVKTRYTADGSVGSPGKCIGFQYAPDYTWFIGNICYNTSAGAMLFGIYGGSNSGLGVATPRQYAVGNVIAGIHHGGGAFRSGTAWAEGAAIMMAGGYYRYIVNNTLWANDQGIGVPGSGGGGEIVNNIIGGLLDATGSHITIEVGSYFDSVTMRNNLFAGGLRVKRGSTSYASLAQLQAIGKCAGCLNADPLFVNLSIGDLHLSSQSPAIDRGSASSVYEAFVNRYGLSIMQDADGISRPSGAGLDMGAYEYR